MIEAYKRLWPDRQGVQRIKTQDELEKSILVELNDELTHPRVRKSMNEKLELAIVRVEESALAEDEKIELIQLYKKLAAQ
ncbi:DUF4572 domain-containing protein [Planococcus sp. CP5-4]|uniref:DUF4572 domain-containing protein n=1 Tax=unclassified Planococcus (in: firmicutes) TaxID=2662419 RepID=UPI001C23BD14|nr:MULTISPECIES: DUF4572 domain-containing protein [unclassified Planococcus (in: firmicutes)]MBU9674817.1 DUF4572 domain-containing protein [Planococcus sp. CP5-4_YE]MBV0910550.1 DUF4572 domain-containing protein [Planococcus sp. CP5-4_UN]MBW6065357.1 DUF4572 domain-containing protein [Planococcus sp. CP5-4]